MACCGAAGPGGNALVYRGGSLHPVSAGRGDQLVAPTQSGQMVAELVRNFCRAVLVREDRDGRTAGVPVVPPGASLGSYVRKGQPPKASKRETHPKMRVPLRHPFPSRTRSLSSSAPMVLREQLRGRVARRRIFPPRSTPASIRNQTHHGHPRQQLSVRCADRPQGRG